jgi:hypothetical protein
MKKSIILGVLVVVVGGVIWLARGGEKAMSPQALKFPEPADAVEAAYAKATTEPIFCQMVLPGGFVMRNVYEQGDEAQVLVTAKDKSVTKQALVFLNKSDNSWTVSENKCTDGEVAPVREFSFEQEGFLIKHSVPKPFNNKNWHIVFTKDNKPGNVVPLLFDGKSQCTNLEGMKAVCKPDTLSEASKVMVYGQMSERGATVVRLDFVK